MPEIGGLNIKQQYFQQLYWEAEIDLNHDRSSYVLVFVLWIHIDSAPFSGSLMPHILYQPHRSLICAREWSNRKLLRKWKVWFLLWIDLHIYWAMYWNNLLAVLIFYASKCSIWELDEFFWSSWLINIEANYVCVTITSTITDRVCPCQYCQIFYLFVQGTQQNLLWV